MEAIRKKETVMDGKVLITLPKQFWGKEVEIIVLASAENGTTEKVKKSLRGCLNQFADLSQIDLESNAWQEAMSKKHDVN